MHQYRSNIYINKYIGYQIELTPEEQALPQAIYSKKNAEYMTNSSIRNENSAIKADNTSSSSMEVTDSTKYVLIYLIY